MMIDISGMVWMLLVLGALAIAALWGCWELVDYLWIDDAIRTNTPMVP